MKLQKKLLNYLHPLLKPIAQWYSSKTREYKYGSLTLKIYPGIFHPGLFFSTRILADHLEKIEVKNKRLLELGAGSGMLSLLAAKRGAFVTASDINPVAVKNLQENFSINGVRGEIIQSDLFEKLNVRDYDIIFINPPYYPREVKNEKDYAWYCGPAFEYFEKLFQSLRGGTLPIIRMILSEDCDRVRIESIAEKYSLLLKEVYSVEKGGEKNFIFSISSASQA